MMLNYWKLFSINKLFNLLFQSFGTLWVFFEIFTYFFGDQHWISPYKNDWRLFLLFGLVICLFRLHPRNFLRTRIAGTDVDIEVKVKDIFSSNGAMIAGCNTTFDVSVKNKNISEKSVQGKYIKRYFKEESQFEEQIKDALKPLPPFNIRTREEKNIGNLDEYELGTTISVGEQSRKIYLVAISRLNIHGTAHVDDNSFLDLLPKMWTEIRSKGGMEEIDCPILGSGYSRLRMNRQDLLFELIKSFVAATREGKFTEKITFYISHDDFRKSHIQWETVKRFLECECSTQLRDSTVINVPKGTPI